MRILLLALLALSACAAEPPCAPAYPLWDGQEPIEQYARRVNLAPTQTLDLGNGVKLELVLIPAGRFTMGTPEPTPVDEESFRKKILLGQAVLAAGVGVLLVFLGVIVIRAIRRRRWPQYSLARFVAMILAASVGVLGGMHWWHSARAFSEAKAEYQAALARFKDSYEWEKPAHEVTLSTPYYMGKWEVTQEQFEKVTGVNPSHFRGRFLPVEQVSWNNAQEFCRKASEVARSGGSRGDPEGRPTVMRLPTEAEWEHACRAGTKATYYTGDADADLDRAAWHDTNTTHPVGQKTPNAWGLHDMHGNVCEWCQDGFADYEAGTASDPQGASQGRFRALRGGSFLDVRKHCRSAFRFRYYPEFRYFSLGFRVVVPVPPRIP